MLKISVSGRSSLIAFSIARVALRWPETSEIYIKIIRLGRIEKLNFAFLAEFQESIGNAGAKLLAA